ncbi:conserved hypothetical protein [Vibrio chagasii]|uniref:DUF2971 domain-containing protein n=1 Tax=Vibrio TaxID=662 RepID=UPI000CF4A140|nr:MULTISPECIES: DUF2971 domain-containing protein [Vibrio]CAH6781210.1 conserved hypothetical protein [Vibrio chagasii]NOI96190.1 DUF2971 domain-containing protein [Vibrio sp. T3Y01]PQJ56318.1 hypothetical protein BTO12_01845 [Vibrio splendidus]CAH6798336.1 conserved hypothetical protein [Vibrio chagasii]CAH6798615.1 conserved hypothetical protein [Vibrio chagasii]
MLPKLYKFRSLHDRNIQSISECSLWFDYAKSFNNPFDSNHIFNQCLQNDFKVMCFSQSSDHPILWSQYGDNFKGMCIEYDLNYYEGDANLNCFEVQYEDHPNNISLPLLEKLPPLSLGTELFKVKHSNWRYEREYRWVLPKEELEGNKLFLNKQCLTSVILSEHAPADRKLKLLMTCQRLGIPVKQAMAKQDSFTFEAVC